MNVSKFFAALVCMSCLMNAFAAPQSGGKMFRHSTTEERERPELNEETKRLIAAYRRDPTQKNYDALKKQVAINYDKVIARKKAKLEELRRTARHQSKVREMEEIVNEVVRDRDYRIEQSMRRFTDPRLRPGARTAKDRYLPVIGAAQNLSIARTPVTNAEYAKFIQATGRTAPKGWNGGKIPAGKENHPVVNVSYADAAAYCKWLTQNDRSATYRLPTETEWEYAAGHMPKDADFNCGIRNGTTAVTEFARTLSACGAVDMWGNCWEWTSTPVSRKKSQMTVKGGSWRAGRMDCRTEHRGDGRETTLCADDVGFRVIREK